MTAPRWGGIAGIVHLRPDRPKPRHLAVLLRMAARLRRQGDLVQARAAVRVASGIAGRLPRWRERLSRRRGLPLQWLYVVEGLPAMQIADLGILRIPPAP